MLVKSNLFIKFIQLKFFSERNMAHSGWGLGREVTQDTMTDKCSYIRGKKRNYTAKAKGEIKKLNLGNTMLVLSLSFAVTSWVTLNVTLLNSGILSFLFCTIRQEGGGRDQYEESERAVLEEVPNLRQQSPTQEQEGTA